MYLKKLKLINYRKFREQDNEVEFVDASSYSDVESGVNIATTATLIVGKNNAGKTTIVQALDKIINRNNIIASDFNYFYLRELYANYVVGNYRRNTPEIEFDVTIGLDKNTDDYVTNIAPFMTLGDVNATEIKIIIKYETLDETNFIEAYRNVLSKGYEENIAFEKLLELIDNTTFKPVYYNKNMIPVEKFKLKDLMEFVMIKANNISGDNCLSESFNTIIKYRYQELFKADMEKLEDKLLGINKTLTKDIQKRHTKDINNTLRRIVSNNDLQVMLSSDVTFQKMMQNLVKYEYVEGGNRIPENQFGLGYTNLMMIIANLIDYMEKYPDNSFNSRINLIVIEEPETYMHPQMQELFIRYINDAISTLLSIKQKRVNSQLIITTHSSHILNSKIQDGGNFNNINYITANNNQALVIPLNDAKIVANGSISDDEFKFIKKHIKYKFSDMFFADAVILVEGISEYNLLPYYLERSKKLRHKYISVLNINGAHGMVYNTLLKALKIPAVIITDLDIKRTEDEKKTYKQISKLTERETTNQTIIHYNANGIDIDNVPQHFQDDNIYITFQNKVGYYYATSFEEALIASNSHNEIVNKVLKKLKPDIYKEIVGDPENMLNNKKNSFKWQCKLASAKSDFSNEILYCLLTTEGSIPSLPKYIQDGLEYLESALE